MRAYELLDSVVDAVLGNIFRVLFPKLTLELQIDDALNPLSASRFRTRLIAIRYTTRYTLHTRDGFGRLKFMRTLIARFLFFFLRLALCIKFVGNCEKIRDAYKVYTVQCRRCTPVRQP